MVNTLSHLGIGFLIALALGFKGKKRNMVAFLAILPDLDFIPYILFALLSSSVSHETRNQLFYLLGHREFMHSILFILLITLFIWLRTKDRLFTAAGFAAILSHSYLDYATSWKMRPFYPFSTESSIMGAVYFFDPIANLLPLLPLFIVLVGYQKNRGRWNSKFNNFCTFVTNNHRSLYRILAVVLLVWITVLPVAKFFLVNQVSEAEETKISYQGTYPVSPGRFLTAYECNDTHFKIMEISYLSGIERSDFIEKVNSTGGVPNAAAYAERVGEELYSTAVPQEIDYPVYSVSENGGNGSVTVLLSDARNSYVESWAYFRTVYRFVFDKESGEYEAYASEQEGRERRLEGNYFKYN
ncbi:metal-dependent hydrolase [Methanosarcina hadiensis]|uniref:metal-dependent hydrolase n=1 Tax=Methanosarcina hadiensis TaxID=3078083 RepID=UPI0039777F8B